MQRAKSSIVKYDPAVKEHPDFKSLYAKWLNLRSSGCRDGFAQFFDFFEWSLAHGYEAGAKLVRIDESKPYGPHNCRWEPPKQENRSFTEQEKEWISKWNEAVNRIRVHFGMEPFIEEGEPDI